MLTTALRLALLFEMVNAAYLAAFDSASIFYHVQVVAHVVAGLVLIVALLPLSVMVLGGVWAALHPQRGLQDRLAGTFLVPR